MNNTRRIALISGVAVVIVAATSGCFAAPAPGPTTTAAPLVSAAPTPSATSTPTPTSTSTALPADVLFRITATATIPTGASVDLVETVYQPAPLTAAQKAIIVQNCGPSSPAGNSLADLNAEFASSLDFSGIGTATLRPDSPAWSKSSGDQLLFGFGDFGAFTGAYQGFQEPCAAGFITVPGTQTMTTLVPASNPSNGLSGSQMGWAYDQFGFVRSDGSDGYGGNAVLSNCTIQLSPAAAANPVAAKWPAVATTGTAPNGCWFAGLALPS